MKIELEGNIEVYTGDVPIPISDAAILSQAISLKRIADLLYYNNLDLGLIRTALEQIQLNGINQTGYKNEQPKTKS